MTLALVFQALFAGMGRPVPAGNRKPPPSRSASLNRWTGKPHEHARARARHLARIAKVKARREA